MDKPQILYEDNHLLVVIKPPNMPIQGDASGDLDLLTAMKQDIKIRHNKPGAVYLGLVHRLDRPVGGLVVFARTSKAAARLSEQLRQRTVRRSYWAIVQGEAPDSGMLQDFLLKDGSSNTVRVVPPETPGAKEAILHFRCLDRKDGLSLLEIRLETGRSHQIRVQCAHAGHALWGDARYGGGQPGQQIALWAIALTLKHPTRKEPLDFHTPPPASFPWPLFNQGGTHA